MAKLTKGIRKIIAGLVGLPLLAAGILLIPLPGPGVLISLLAFFILSLEFDWAEKYFSSAKSVIKKIYEESKEKAAKIDKDLK